MTEVEEILWAIDVRLNKSLKQRIVLIRNYDGLPRVNPGKDIDIIVRKRDLSSWRQAMRDAASSLGLRAEKIADSYYHQGFLFLQGDRQVLKIDLNFLLDWRGVRFADVDTIVSGAVLHEAPIYVAASGLERALVTFHHSFLYGGTIQEKYLPLFQAEIKRDAQLFLSELGRVLMQSDAQWMTRLLQVGEYRIPRRTANAIRIRAMMKAVMHNPFRFLVGFFGPMFRRVPE